MTTLKASLENLISNYPCDCSIGTRLNVGYKLVFKDLIPQVILVQLIAYCTFHNHHYYISAADSNIEFHIYKH